ncbi:MAG: ribbon-helix-helix domain-containing protein [Acidobacteriota bacterium]
MKRKIGTLIDDTIFSALKILAAKDKKKISEVIEEAIILYLKKRKKGVVEKSEGAIKLPLDIVREVLEEENFYET